MSALHCAMNTTPSNRSVDQLRAVARARYHGYARAFVASQPPFALLANGPKESATEDFWARLLDRPHTQPAPSR